MHYLQQISLLMQRAKGLGSRTLPNGTQLIGRVPHVAPKAWLHALFAPISDSEIDRIEAEIGGAVPEVFRDFLTLANGLSVFSGSLSIYGFRTSFERGTDAVWQPFSIITPNTVERLRDAQDSYFFIGGYPSGSGYLLYIDKTDEKVSRYSRKSAVPLQMWQNFPEMLVQETHRLANLFDPLGRKMNPGQPLVP